MLVTSQDSAADDIRARDSVENTPQQTKKTVMAAVTPKTTKSVRGACSTANAAGDCGMPLPAFSGSEDFLVMMPRLLVTPCEAGSTVTPGRDPGNSEAGGTHLGDRSFARWWPGA